MLICTFYHAYFFHTLTVKGSIINFCWITAIGYVLRCLTHHSIYVLYTGQLIVGFANAYHINLRFRMFQYWFAPENLKHSLTYVMLLMLIGKGFLNVTPYLFIDEATQSNDEQQAGILKLYTLTIVACAVGIVVTQLFYIEKPPKGYGSLVEASEGFKILGFAHFLEEIRLLLWNPLFAKLLVMMCFANISLNNISDALNLAMVGFGYKQTDGSWSLCFLYVTGLIGAIIYDKYMHHLRDEKRFLIMYTYSG